MVDPEVSDLLPRQLAGEQTSWQHEYCGFGINNRTLELFRARALN
jgi:hypothetical protein